MIGSWLIISYNSPEQGWNPQQFHGQETWNGHAGIIWIKEHCKKCERQEEREGEKWWQTMEWRKDTAENSSLVRESKQPNCTYQPLSYCWPEVYNWEIVSTPLPNPSWADMGLWGPWFLFIKSARHSKQGGHKNNIPVPVNSTSLLPSCIHLCEIRPRQQSTKNCL